jgi:hypothetical protein
MHRILRVVDGKKIFGKHHGRLPDHARRKHAGLDRKRDGRPCSLHAGV